MKVTTDTIFMVRPTKFRMNEETALNNYYQKTSNAVGIIDPTTKAQQEFDAFVEKLRGKGIDVIVLNSKEEEDTPDSIFPNNWISFHNTADVALYPMYAENRRRERRPEDILNWLDADGFQINNVIDYTSAEEEEIFLEGTGSMILDRINRKAYCALSERSYEELFIEFCEDFEYTPVVFVANQTVNKERKPIYHTNVMMNVGEKVALICLDAIDDKKERKNVVKHLKDDGKVIVDLTEEQLCHFAGNAIQLQSQTGEPYLVMSSAAYTILTDQQRQTIEKHLPILHSDLSTIETLGGGSARCMIAEIFLPKRNTTEVLVEEDLQDEA